jgi:hypothetical protein
VVLCKNTFSGESIPYVIAGMPQAAKGKVIDHNRHSRETEKQKRFDIAMYIDDT